MSIGRACGGYFLTAGNGESGFGNREPSAGSREPEAGSRKSTTGSRQPGAGSLHYALAHPCPGVGGERLYTLLRPTACQGGEGHAVARGDCRQPTTDSRQPKAGTTLLRPTACQGGEGHAVARGGIAEGTPVADSRQPEAGSLHYALARPCPGMGGERLYTLLRPTACQGGEGHAVARGDCRRHAGSRKPAADSRQAVSGSLIHGDVKNFVFLD